MTLKNNTKVKFKVTIQVFVQNTKAFVRNISLENAYFRWSAVNDLEMILKVNESHDLNTYWTKNFPIFRLAVSKIGVSFWKQSWPWNDLEGQLKVQVQGH